MDSERVDVETETPSARRWKGSSKIPTKVVALCVVPVGHVRADRLGIGIPGPETGEEMPWAYIQQTFGAHRAGDVFPGDTSKKR